MAEESGKAREWATPHDLLLLGQGKEVPLVSIEAGESRKSVGFELMHLNDNRSFINWHSNCKLASRWSSISDQHTHSWEGAKS